MLFNTSQQSPFLISAVPKSCPSDNNDSCEELSTSFMESVATEKNLSVSSIPIPFLLFLTAATTVVPVPRNGSNTVSPCLLYILINLSHSFSG